MSDAAWTDGTDNEVWDVSPWELLPGVRTGDELTRGEKAADQVRNRMGSWGFVGSFLGFMAIWGIVNSLAFRNHGFDPYPYILLNLFLSMLAGLQGAILLIAAKRADAVAAEQALSHLTISKSSSELIKDVRNELAKTAEMTKIIKRLSDEIHQTVKEKGNQSE